MRREVPNHLINQELKEKDKELLDLAKTNETPFYVYSADMLQLSYKKLREFLPKEFTIYYSLKANPNSEVIRYFGEAGTYFDTCSLGEMQKVCETMGNLEKALLIGPGKRVKEIEYAVQNGIHYIILESLEDARKVQQVCIKKDKRVNVAFRINPGTGKGVMAMGGETQFGMDQATVLSLFERKEEYSQLDMKGLHSYVGTGNTNSFAIIDNTTNILNAFDELIEKTGMECEFIDIGGGFGIPYTNSDKSLNLEEIKDEFTELISQFQLKHPSLKELAMESGRFLVGESGLFVTTVLDVKETFGKTYVILDGGLNSYHNVECRTGFLPTPMRLIEKAERKEGRVTICGPLCTPADKFAHSIPFSIPEIGDHIVFYHTGAYAHTSSPILFLGHPISREILI